MTAEKVNLFIWWFPKVTVPAESAINKIMYRLSVTGCTIFPPKISNKYNKF